MTHTTHPDMTRPNQTHPKKYRQEGLAWKTTSQEDDSTGKRPHRKTTSQEDDLTGRRPHRKMISQEEDLTGRKLYRKTISLEDKFLEDDLTGR